MNSKDDNWQADVLQALKEELVGQAHILKDEPMGTIGRHDYYLFKGLIIIVDEMCAHYQKKQLQKEKDRDNEQDDTTL